MHQPFIKFLTQQFTYFLFIIFIIISSVIVSDGNINTDKLSVVLKDTYYDNYTKYTARTDIKQHFRFTDFSIRIDKPTIVDYLLSVWIIGLVWQEIKIFYNYGFKDYLRSWNNIINSVTNSLYVASFTLKYISFFKVKYHRDRIFDSTFWDMAVNMNESNIDAQDQVINTIYWLNNGNIYFFFYMIKFKIIF